MSIGQNFTGALSDVISVYQQELTFYLNAQQAFTNGAQSYKIGTRELNRMDPFKLQQMIDALLLKITLLQHGGKRRSFGFIPRDI